MRISISDACTGHGRCYSLAPDLFDCDDRGYGIIASAEVSAEHEADALAAAANCPEGAITAE